MNDLDFKPLINKVARLFSRYFPDVESQITETFQLLCMANFACYKANMKILDLRKNSPDNYKEIADTEWIARSVGEIRVFSKYEINTIIFYSVSCSSVSSYVDERNDDIAYSVGEMLDRLSIEFIKMEYFLHNNIKNCSIEDSSAWSNIVFDRLKTKLASIKARDCYSINQERRTYNLDNISPIDDNINKLYRKILSKRMDNNDYHTTWC